LISSWLFIFCVLENITSLLELFDLFITLQHHHIITEHINSNAIKLQYEEKKNTRNLKNFRRWYFINKYKIEIFIDILLYMSVYHCSKYENYWNIFSVRLFYIEIQNAISCSWFKQILRYWKISDSDEILNSSDFDFWKKLESLTTNIQASSCQYWKIDRNVSVNEQLILFQDWIKHFMQLSIKIVNQSFKIYSLCEQNYILDFLFISKIHFISCFSHTNLLKALFLIIKLILRWLSRYLKSFQENYLKKILKKNSVMWWLDKITVLSKWWV